MTAKKKAAKTKPPKKPDNRPIQAEAILDLIANHKTPVGKACAHVGVKTALFYSWVREDKYGLREQFQEAREQYFEMLRDECLEIADDSSDDFQMTERGPVLRGEHVQRSALRISTRKWLVETGAPAKTGFGRDTEDDDDATVNAAIAALERIAMAKAATIR